MWKRKEANLSFEFAKLTLIHLCKDKFCCPKVMIFGKFTPIAPHVGGFDVHFVTPNRELLVMNSTHTGTAELSQMFFCPSSFRASFSPAFLAFQRYKTCRPIQ